MKLIRKWLDSSRNFYVGAALYNSFGKDEHVLKVLSKGRTDISQALLVQMLEKLLISPVSIEIHNAAVITQQVNHSPGRTIPHFKDSHTPMPPPARPAAGEMPDGDDLVLKALKNEWMAPYQRMNFLRSQLHQYGATNDSNAIASRGEKALEILRLERECMEIWQRRDYYLENKALPDVIQKGFEKPTDPVALGSAIEATKRRIREWRTKSQANQANSHAAEKYLHYRKQYFLLTGTEYKNA
jgi:hypothetical protein